MSICYRKLMPQMSVSTKDTLGNNLVPLPKHLKPNKKRNPAFKLTNALVYRILNSEDIYGVPPIFQAQRAVLMSAMLSGENTTTS
jgi:hypothetical protein